MNLTECTADQLADQILTWPVWKWILWWWLLWPACQDFSGNVSRPDKQGGGGGLQQRHSSSGGHSSAESLSLSPSSLRAGRSGQSLQHWRMGCLPLQLKDPTCSPGSLCPNSPVFTLSKWLPVTGPVCPALGSEVSMTSEMLEQINCLIWLSLSFSESFYCLFSLLALPSAVLLLCQVSRKTLKCNIVLSKKHLQFPLAPADEIRDQLNKKLTFIQIVGLQLRNFLPAALINIKHKKLMEQKQSMNKIFALTFDENVRYWLKSGKSWQIEPEILIK